MSSRAPIRRFVCAVLLLAGARVFCQVSAEKQAVSSSSLIAQAKRELAKNDTKSAEDSIWKVLSSDPNNSSALIVLGEIRGRQARYPEAETLFQRVLQLDPKSLTGHLSLGKTYLAENKFAEAMQQYQQAQELAPKNVEVEVTLAKLQSAVGDSSAAMSSLNAVPPEHFPPEAIPVKVGCLLALGQQDAAIALAQHSADPSIQLAEAEIFVNSKLPQQALKLLNAAASGRRPPPRFYFIKAEALDAAGEQTAAVQNFQKALSLQPASGEFMLALAEMYARQNKHAAAYEQLRQAYKLDQSSPKILRPLILEASFAGKSSEAQDAAETLSKNSEDPQDLYVAASVFLKTGRQGEAVPLLEKYVAKSPDDATAWVGLGVGYVDLKRNSDAQKAFERALEVDPKFADAEYQLGALASGNGDSTSAIQHFERAVQMNPKHGPSLEKVGSLYLEAGEFEKARDVLLRAETLNPNNRQTEYGLALACSKLGNREEAKIHMERFQKMGPIGSTEGKP